MNLKLNLILKNKSVINIINMYLFLRIQNMPIGYNADFNN